MDLLKNTIISLILLSGSLFSQKMTTQSISTIGNKPVAEVSSNLVKYFDSDTSFLKIELNNAQYEVAKNNLPYYIISNKTSYNQSAIPQLIIKKTNLVTGNFASVIKKYYGKFLTPNFETTNQPSLSRGENLNQFKLQPFRINAQGQIEELVEYDISWQVISNRNPQPSAAAFKNNSILASGNWYKIGLTKSGIYKLDKNFLRTLGIDLGSLDHTKIRVYGNSGHMVPELNSDFRHDDLEENAIQFVDLNGNGAFDNDEYFLFYATDKNNWKRSTSSAMKFTVEQNIYSDSTFYYINTDLGVGKRVAVRSNLTGSQNVTSNSYDYYNYHEENNINFVKSGRQFFGENFDITTSYGFNFNDGDFVLNDTVYCELNIAGRAGTNTIYNVAGNGLNFNVTTFAIDISNYLAPYVDVQSKTSKGLNTNSGSIFLAISKQTPFSVGWLDKVTVNARRYLNLNKQFQFRDSRVGKTGNICKFTISNPLNQTPTIWNVTDFLNPVVQSYSGGANIDFTTNTDSTLEYVVAPTNDYYDPAFVGKIENQNLHSIQQADYVIVTHPLFVSHAQRLATLHQQKEGLSYAVVTTEQIYNEFSSGKVDIGGIRDFVRMLYSRNIASLKQPKYLLLFGDGSYDNRNHNLLNNTCLIPTYETVYSLGALQSIATDDFFGLMDPNEGLSAEAVGALDIGVGRIVSRNVDEANAVVNKIENYYRPDPNFKIADPDVENCSTETESPYGDWKNWLIFLADDEDQSTHMGDADKIAIKVAALNPRFNQDKVYLDAYQQFSTPGGQRFPDVETDIAKRFKKGALIFNYTGHGGEVGLTAERIVSVESINALDNFNKLPLFITATCEFTRYDDPSRVSAGELCLLNPKGGAISLLTTCRLAFSNSNLTLNSTMYDYMFKKLPDGKKPCLGDIIRSTKSALGQGLNFANFHLIGDPAVTLSYPEQKVLTSKINLSVVTPTTANDTLGALEKVTISGFVADTLGNKLTGFNGVVYPTVFDKELDVTCLLNEESSYNVTPGTPFKFKLQKNILYRGKAEVKNGDFTFTFIVPKDISFAYGPGKISYYATNGVSDAGGNYQKVIIGGGSKSTMIDNAGPQVTLYLNDKNFVSGGTTNEKPILYVHLTDSSGINTLGTSIGHDITAVLDQNSSKPVVLNDYYEANLNSYQSGRIRYPFEQLPEGNHTLTFKAWDIQNNSNVVNTDFVVAPSAQLALTHVLNYPNPFTTNTKFFLEHNQACNTLKVNVQVYTISGKLVKTIQKTVTCEGFRPEGIDWDGKDDFGDKLGRGVYIYKVSILDIDNKKAEKTEKLVILN